KRSSEVVLCRGPIERHTFSCPFLQGFAKGGDGLFKPCRSSFPRSEKLEGRAEIVLNHGPFERRARTGSFLQGFAKGGDGLFQPSRPGLPLTQPCKRIAKIH